MSFFFIVLLLPFFFFLVLLLLVFMLVRQSIRWPEPLNNRTRAELSEQRPSHFHPHSSSLSSLLFSRSATHRRRTARQHNRSRWSSRGHPNAADATDPRRSAIDATESGGDKGSRESRGEKKKCAADAHPPPSSDREQRRGDEEQRKEGETQRTIGKAEPREWSRSRWRI